MQLQWQPNQTNPRVVLEEYIPLKIRFDALQEHHSSVAFVVENHSLLELMVGEQSHQISEITLLNCEQYTIGDGFLPIAPAQDGAVCLWPPQGETALRQPVEQMAAVVYADGIEIRLSGQRANRFVRDGKVVWCMLDGQLVAVRVALSPDERAHTAKELQWQYQ